VSVGSLGLVLVVHISQLFARIMISLSCKTKIM
jgi:hypothetical protein